MSFQFGQGLSQRLAYHCFRGFAPHATHDAIGQFHPEVWSGEDPQGYGSLPEKGFNLFVLLLGLNAGFFFLRKSS